MRRFKNSLKEKIFIATICNEWEEIADKYGLPVELDIFCMAENMEGEKGEESLKMAEDLVARTSVKVLHAPFNELFPAAIDPRARELAMLRLNQAAEIAMGLGIKKMVVHSGYVPFVYFKEWHVARSIEFWDEFMADKPEDFEIAIENVLDDEPEMLMEIVQGIGRKNVGMCLDVGHASVASDIPAEAWAERAAGVITHIHLHNNDGKADGHKPVAQGVIDNARILDIFMDKCRDDATLTIETMNIGDSMEWMDEYFSKRGL